MKPYLSMATLALALAGGDTLFAAEAVSLNGPLIAVPLLQNSKNQPSMAVLVGNALYFTEGKNLESDKLEDCPAADLYRYDLTEKRETRIGEFSCVVDVLSDGTAAYVVARDKDSALVVSRVADGRTVEAAPANALAKIKARISFKRSVMKLPSDQKLTHTGYVMREGQLNAIFQTEGYLFLDAVVFDKASKQAVLPFPIKGGAAAPCALNGESLFYTFVKGDEGWLRVVENKVDGTNSLFGHQRPLPKKWSEAGRLDWSVRKPRFLSGIPDGFLVADRTSEAFSEATAVSWYSKTNDKFYRLDIDDKDVGGVSYVAEGALISKPMIGSIVWYGKKNPFKKNEDKK